uniref:Uncharacterized protein n=1 Tax=Eutreptiella gymnastica TaxID=73025 RepID=A0A7S1IZV7_9EUGL|mmetsp:Transcript_56604/g.100887  ORF Transcript_56604/g.100887 Transcript_56604/m.100887 type:complete len:109 (+) Transcript_56604:191-517(+)
MQGLDKAVQRSLMGSTYNVTDQTEHKPGLVMALLSNLERVAMAQSAITPKVQMPTWTYHGLEGVPQGALRHATNINRITEGDANGRTAEYPLCGAPGRDYLCQLVRVA